MSPRSIALTWPLLLLACGQATVPPDGGNDAQVNDSGAPDAGPAQPKVAADHSLFFTDAQLLDDAGVVTFSSLMAAASDDGHGGLLLDQWFHRFATTAHSERALPAQFIDGVAAQQGADPAGWNLSALPFKVTGAHNRIDLASLTVGGHCGELRASVSCTDVTLQPFHALFIFRQPAEADDLEPGTGRVTCRGTAGRWADLSRLEGESWRAALTQRLQQGLTHERFLLLETVEFTLAPWEWRQWTKVVDPSSPLPYVLDNPPLFQQADVEGLNPLGPRRADFLAWVEQNAAGLDARTVLLPERFRAPSVRVTQGVPRVPLSLDGLLPGVTAAFPQLRQHVELMGCAACHTADADFVQTHTDRSVSKFYEKELLARERHLEALADGLSPAAPFGPLQADPVLPP